ncbi:cytochrome c-type biogenesis protein CcmH, partial [Vibrio makurazakiensis]|uniref:cytochrome c-type biogenesis protein CcmH n=1 Tax=Vibrio makurazakiensis TaxID=2910250 RepID=UPI003D09DD2A
MIKNLKDLCILFVLVFSSFSVFSESTFVAADKSVIKQVELFEFDSPEQQRSAVALAKSLRCPQCQNQNLIESNSPIAKDLRLKVFLMIKEGKSDQYVIDYMADRFGEFVLYKPGFNSSTFLLWLLPIFIF